MLKEVGNHAIELSNCRKAAHEPAVSDSTLLGVAGIDVREQLEPRAVMQAFSASDPLGFDDISFEHSQDAVGVLIFEEGACGGDSRSSILVVYLLVDCNFRFE